MPRSKRQLLQGEAQTDAADLNERAGAEPSPVQTAMLTMAALIAFAANSVICRVALDDAVIDAASFTTVRLASGALTLWLVIKLVAGRSAPPSHGSWLSATMLFLYAVTFSFAYIDLGAGTGALILFGTVQATMIIAGICWGERPHPLQWIGLFIGLGGLCYLVFPGMTAPSLTGSLLMAVAGIAWGVYSLRGFGGRDPTAVTASNFLRTLPLALIASAFLARNLNISAEGFVLAATSGALPSALGYVVWYAALRGLSTTRAATVQLSVPVLATFGGVIFLGEAVTLRFAASTLMILGGIGLSLIAKPRRGKTKRLV